jgi:uncharacterized membrane protein
MTATMNPGEATRPGSAGSGSNVGSMERVVSALAGSAVALHGLRRGGASGLLLAAVGGIVAKRGFTGHCDVYGALGVSTAEPESGVALPPAPPRALELSAAITVGLPPEETYRHWRDFESHPRFMRLIESVRQTDERVSHWVARGPVGMQWEWDSELTEDRPGERIAWQTLQGAEVPQVGSVAFRPASGERGTEVHFRLRLDPPGGPVGLALGKLLGDAPDKMIRDDLRRFKQLVETGEIATVDGQPSGRA